MYPDSWPCQKLQSGLVFVICQAIIKAGAQTPVAHLKTAEKCEIEAFLPGRQSDANVVVEINLDSYLQCVYS